MAQTFFEGTKKGEIAELQSELNNLKESKRVLAVKKVIALMTVGKDVSSLFTDVLKCITTNNLELKKLVYLYIMNYAKQNSENAILAVNTFHQDASDSNPLIRALAIRTMGMIRVEKIMNYLPEPLRKCLLDEVPYVAKTAALCVAKLYDMNPEVVEEQGFLDMLRDLLSNSNHTVVSNAVAALTEIQEVATKSVWQLTKKNLSKMLTALAEATEWGQVYILSALSKYTPKDSREAEAIVDRVTPRLNHANSAVVLGATKVILFYVDVIAQTNKDKARELMKKLRAPLVTLLSKEPEIQYVALRNLNLIVQRHKGLLGTNLKVFFCKYYDPVYVKMEKLELLIMLAADKTIDQVLLEFKEYAQKVDVEFVRKSVRGIGRLAIKNPSASEKCVHVLLDLIKTTQANYVVQEAIVVLKDIFRKYPNKYESIIGTLCDRLDNLDEAEAKAAMIWIIGEYADRIANADELLSVWVESFHDEDTQVQLQLLTATVKLFLQKPSEPSSQTLVQDILKRVTTAVDNPDLRDRGFLYWRLLHDAPNEAKRVVLADKPLLDDQSDLLEPTLRDELLHHLSTLASVYHRPPRAFVPKLKNISRPTLDTTLPTNTVKKPSGASSSPSPSPSPAPAPVQQPAPVVDLLGGLTTSSPPPTDAPPAVSPSLLGNVPVASPTPPATPPASAAATSNGLALVLSPSDPSSNGLTLYAGFKLEGGQVTLDLTFTNNSSGVASGFVMKFNKNGFSVNPTAAPSVQQLQPGETQSCSLPCTIGEVNPELLATNAVQVGLKSSLGVAIFGIPLPLQQLFVADGQLEKGEYLQMWKDIQTEHYSDIAPVFTADVQAVTTKLHQYKIYSVAQRNVNGQDFLYLSSKLFNGTNLLMELAFTGTTCKLCVKTREEMYVPSLQAAAASLLSSA